MNESNRHPIRLRAAVALLAVVPLSAAAPAAASPSETLCAYRFTRMASAQTSRVLKEIFKCVKRNPATYAAECLPEVSSGEDLTSPDETLTRALKHVERHGDEKFPRKCEGVREDFFEPACHDIADTSAQLRRCLYNDYTLPFAQEALEMVSEFSDDGACGHQALNQFRIIWREWMDYAGNEPDDAFNHKLGRVQARIARSCDAAGTDQFVQDMFERLRVHSADIRAVVPFDERR